MTSLKSPSKRSSTKEGSLKMTNLWETFSRSVYQESCKARKKQSSICYTISSHSNLLMVRTKHRLQEPGLRQNGGMMRRIGWNREIILSQNARDGCIEWHLKSQELRTRMLVMHHRLVDHKGLLLRMRSL